MRKSSRNQGPMTTARLLDIYEQLPDIVRGSAAHDSLIRELAGDSAATTLLFKLYPEISEDTFMPAIYGLPEDILEMIFSAVADIAPPRGPMLYSDLSAEYYTTKVVESAQPVEKMEKDDTGRVFPSLGVGHSTLGWITLGHVCTRWRALIFRMPSLWARHLGTLPGPAFDYMLYWSGNTAPVSIITLTSSMRPGAEEELQAALRSHAGLVQRVETMRLERTIRESRRACPFKTILQQNKTHRFTGLRSLDVFANVTYNSDIDYHSLPVIDAAQLSSLRFEDFFLRWSSSVLVNLDISGAAGKLQIPLLLILDLVRVSVNTLRSLRLYRCIQTSEDLAIDALQGTSPLLLPHLNEFHLGSTVEFSILFLSRAIIIPRTTHCNITSTREFSTLAPSLPLLRFIWETFVSSDRDVAVVISDPHRYQPDKNWKNFDDCLVEVYEGVVIVDGIVLPLIGRRPRLTFRCCAASGIANLEHIFNFMEGYHITMLSLLFEKLFPIETKTVMKSLLEVRFLHMNNFQYVGDLDNKGPAHGICNSPDHLPNVETLSIVYDSRWTLPWVKLSRYLARRPTIRTVIIHDHIAIPIEEKELCRRHVLDIIGRLGLEVQWVFSPLWRDGKNET